MRLFNTHTCECYLYGENQLEQCQCQTQTRCDVCRRWCCAIHRETLKNDLKRKVTLCSNCIPEPAGDDDDVS